MSGVRKELQQEASEEISEPWVRPSPTQTTELAGNRLRIAVVGDTAFGENYQAQIEKRGGDNILKSKGYRYCLQNFARFLKRSHLVIANLETPLTDAVSSPFERTKPYLHWGDVRRTPRTLQRHNVHAVSLANNHSLDYGVEGLKRSLEALHAQGIRWFGAGKDEVAAAEPLHFDYRLADRSFRLVVVAGHEYIKRADKAYGRYAGDGAAGVNSWKISRAAQQIRKIRHKYGNAFVVAFPHFGINYAWKSDTQTAIAHALIDGGADLVIGHGAHMMQEIEQYKGRWIVYGLGNFVFNSPGRYAHKGVDAFSLVARINVHSRPRATTVTLRLYPIFCDNRITGYQSCFISPEQFAKVRELLLVHSTDKELLESQMKSGVDEYGCYLALDVASLPPLPLWTESGVR